MKTISYKFAAKTVLSIMTFCVCSAVSGQGFYVKGNGGYNWSIGDHYYSWGQIDILGVQPFYLPVENIQESINGEVSHEVLQVSYGKGLSYGVGLGFMFSGYCGLELGINYLRGETIQALSYSSSQGTYMDNHSKAYMWSFAPSLKISAGRTGINPYTRLGAIIGMPSIETIITLNDNGTITRYEDKIEGGTAVGFQGAVGVEYPVSDLITIFWELTYNRLKYKPTRRTVSTFIVNNVDQLATVYPEPETELVEEPAESEIYPNGNKHLTQPLPFGNIGMHVGLALRFGK